MIRVRRRPAMVLAAVLAAAGVLFGASAGQAATSQQDRPQVTPGLAPACVSFLATNPHAQTRVVTTSGASTYASTSWTVVACAASTVSVPRGRRGLVVVHVDAEVNCVGAPAGQWCLGRVVVAGLEGEPRAPEPDSFAWSTSSQNGNQWDAHAFTRTRLVGCPATAPGPCVFSVYLQVRTHVPGLVMRVDDSTVDAQVTYF
jgi:hypothetical protein